MSDLAPPLAEDAVSACRGCRAIGCRLRLAPWPGMAAMALRDVLVGLIRQSEARDAGESEPPCLAALGPAARH